MTLTPHADSLAVELSLPALTTEDCRGWNLKTQPIACRAKALNHCATAAAAVLLMHKNVHTYSGLTVYLTYLTVTCNLLDYLRPNKKE